MGEKQKLDCFIMGSTVVWSNFSGAIMDSTQNYLEFVMDLLIEVPEVTHRKMMGECILYSRGVIFGGIYDDRFLLKDVPATRKAFATEQIPLRRCEANAASGQRRPR